MGVEMVAEDLAEEVMAGEEVNTPEAMAMVVVG